MAGAAASAADAAPSTTITTNRRVRSFTCGTENTGWRLEVAWGVCCAAATTLAQMGRMGKSGWTVLAALLAGAVIVVIALAGGGKDKGTSPPDRQPSATTKPDPSQPPAHPEQDAAKV